MNCPDLFDLQFFKDFVAHLGGDISKVTDELWWRKFGKTFPELLPKAMKFFESATTGNPSEGAYCMVKFCDAPLAWAMRVIENATTGNPALAGCRLVEYCDAPLEWAWALRIKKREEK